MFHRRGAATRKGMGCAGAIGIGSRNAPAAGRAGAHLKFTKVGPDLTACLRGGESMVVFRIGAVLVASIALASCSGSPVSSSGTPRTGAAQGVARRVSTAEITPKRHIVAAGTRIYAVDLVLVDYGSTSRMFASPRAVSESPSGVSIVSAGGEAFEYPTGTRVVHSVGRRLIPPGQAVPLYFRNRPVLETVKVTRTCDTNC